MRQDASLPAVPLAVFGSTPALAPPHKVPRDIAWSPAYTSVHSLDIYVLGFVPNGLVFVGLLTWLMPKDCLLFGLS